PHTMYWQLYDNMAANLFTPTPCGGPSQPPCHVLRAANSQTLETGGPLPVSGTVATSGSSTISGNGTRFTAELFIGDNPSTPGETQRHVVAIADNTHLTIN